MSMSDRDGVIWMDGELVPWREAQVHVLTHTLHYGMGVFEGVRAYKARQGTAIFRLPQHTRRLFGSAHIMKMPVPWDRETIDAVERIRDLQPEILLSTHTRAIVGKDEVIDDKYVFVDK